MIKIIEQKTIDKVKVFYDVIRLSNLWMAAIRKIWNAKVILNLVNYIFSRYKYAMSSKVFRTNCIAHEKHDAMSYFGSALWSDMFVLLVIISDWESTNVVCVFYIIKARHGDYRARQLQTSRFGAGHAKCSNLFEAFANIGRPLCWSEI